MRPALNTTLDARREICKRTGRTLQAAPPRRPAWPRRDPGGGCSVAAPWPMLDRPPAGSRPRMTDAATAERPWPDLTGAPRPAAEFPRHTPAERRADAAVHAL